MCSLAGRGLAETLALTLGVFSNLNGTEWGLCAVLTTPALGTMSSALHGLKERKTEAEWLVEERGDGALGT